ncbi:TM2 domain-containing protein [bacterium]|nr:TM2 domain-containing protein [bacterium]
MEEKKFNTDWLATLLFCLFLGVFGAHRFYVKKTDTAIVMLLISLLTGWIFGLGFYITGIWSVVDLILIICAKFTDGNGNVIDWKV